jgi:hypothetical protein
VTAEVADPQDHYRGLARRLILGMVFSAGLVSTTLLYALSTATATAVAGVLTALVAGLLYLSFRRDQGFGAQPQFTRQRMRQREANEGDSALGFGDVTEMGTGSDGAAAGQNDGAVQSETRSDGD